MQIRNLWSTRSGASVSFSYFAFCVTLFCSFLMYGFEKNSLALIIQPLFRIPFCAIIVMQLIACKRISKAEWFVLCACAGTVIWMCNIDHQGILFRYLNFITAGFILRQAYEIWINRSRGKVTLYFLVVFTASVFFWTVYGLLIDDWNIWFVCLIHTICYSLTVYLWYRFPNK